MSIKKPSMIKPNIKKPSVAKKPAAPVKPAIAEEVQTAVEEKVVEPIAIVEDPVDVAPELLEQIIKIILSVILLTFFFIPKFYALTQKNIFVFLK